MYSALNSEYLIRSSCVIACVSDLRFERWQGLEH